MVSLIQIIPYQPMVPKVKIDRTEVEVNPTILWFHQVNSEYQFQMIDFSINNILSEKQILADYWTQKQVYQYFDRETYLQVFLYKNQRPEPAYILLHYPGLAGGFLEQAEFRSINEINYWRFLDGVSTVYDNGESFILFHPENAFQPFNLEGKK